MTAVSILDHIDDPEATSRNYVGARVRIIFHETMRQIIEAPDNLRMPIVKVMEYAGRQLSTFLCAPAQEDLPEISGVPTDSPLWEPLLEALSQLFPGFFRHHSFEAVYRGPNNEPTLYPANDEYVACLRLNDRILRYDERLKKDRERARRYRLRQKAKQMDTSSFCTDIDALEAIEKAFPSSSAKKAAQTQAEPEQQTTTTLVQGVVPNAVKNDQVGEVDETTPSPVADISVPRSERPIEIQSSEPCEQDAIDTWDALGFAEYCALQDNAVIEPAPSDEFVTQHNVQEEGQCLEPASKDPILTEPAENQDDTSNNEERHSPADCYVFFADNGPTFELTPSVEDQWSKMFGVDVRLEIAKAQAWSILNPRKRKRDIRRFLFNWLKRAGQQKPSITPSMNNARPQYVTEPIWTAFLEKQARLQHIRPFGIQEVQQIIQRYVDNEQTEYANQQLSDLVSSGKLYWANIDAHIQFRNAVNMAADRPWKARWEDYLRHLTRQADPRYTDPVQMKAQFDQLINWEKQQYDIESILRENTMATWKSLVNPHIGFMGKNISQPVSQENRKYLETEVDGMEVLETWMTRRVVDDKSIPADRRNLIRDLMFSPEMKSIWNQFPVMSVVKISEVDRKFVEMLGRKVYENKLFEVHKSYDGCLEDFPAYGGSYVTA